MSGSRPGREESPLDDETPGSQGEIEAGSEGDFGDGDSVDEEPPASEEDQPPTD